MKKIVALFIPLFLMCNCLAVAQNQPAETQKLKNDQSDLANDVYVSYGLGSFYFIINQDDSYSYKTTGSIIVGYARSMGRVVAVGFQAAFTNISRTPNYSYVTTKYSDNYWSGLANIRFRYYNRPSFSMYSGVALGITMISRNETSSSGEKSRQEYLPAGQLTLLGFRVGRALSFFGEFGIGTNAIINAGISYKFGE